MFKYIYQNKQSHNFMSQLLVDGDDEDDDALYQIAIHHINLLFQLIV